MIDWGIQAGLADYPKYRREKSWPKAEGPDFCVSTNEPLFVL
jgi:hypothetical protein